jgi:hypothetical protein
VHAYRGIMIMEQLIVKNVHQIVWVAQIKWAVVYVLELIEIKLINVYVNMDFIRLTQIRTVKYV